jgi:hypothetical protein
VGGLDAKPSVARLRAKSLGSIEGDAAERATRLASEIAIASRDVVDPRTRLRHDVNDEFQKLIA